MGIGKLTMQAQNVQLLNRNKSTKSSQGIYWFLTIPAANWASPAALPEGLSWIRGQKETGEGGFLHWQVVCSVPQPVRLLRLKNMFCAEAHVELCRSAAAEAYVWKDDTYVEGTRFEFGK